MFLKTLLIATPVILGGLYVAGNFDASADGKDVELASPMELTDGKVGDPATCRRFFKRAEKENLARSFDDQMEDRSFASGVRTIMRVHEIQAQATRLGCTDAIVSEVREVHDQDASADNQLMGTHSSSREQEITPGQPMLDPRPSSERPRW